MIGKKGLPLKGSIELERHILSNGPHLELKMRSQLSHTVIILLTSLTLNNEYVNAGRLDVKLTINFHLIGRMDRVHTGGL